MRRFILTGAPGSGKTSILLHLQQKGHAVVAEAATDVIAAEQARGIDGPWLDPAFIDKIIDLQRSRQLAPPHFPAPPRPAAAGAAAPGTAAARTAAVGGLDGVQFFDRSPVCTLALARFLGHPESPALARELDRIAEAGIYQPKVFFVRLLGSIEPTAARRITYAESLEFERVHETEYSQLGYHLVDIPPMSITLRAGLVARYGIYPHGQAGPL
jgi:predicted ATPase